MTAATAWSTPACCRPTGCRAISGQSAPCTTTARTSSRGGRAVGRPTGPAPSPRRPRRVPPPSRRGFSGRHGAPAAAPPSGEGYGSGVRCTLDGRRPAWRRLRCPTAQPLAVLRQHSGAGTAPPLTDAELRCLAVAQVLLGFPSARHWIRFAHARLGHLFRYLPEQSAYNKRLNAVGPLISRVIEALARQVPTWNDGLRLIDSTPLPSRPPARSSNAPTWQGTAATATAAATPASSGAFASTWSPPPRACPSPGAWPNPRSASGR